MKLNEQGVLIIEEQDIHNLYFYLVHDGTAFKDSFRFEMGLQGIELHPGSVSAVDHPQAMPEGCPEEDLPLCWRRSIRSSGRMIRASGCGSSCFTRHVSGIREASDRA